MTLAYLLDKSADELSEEVKIAMPANGSGGLPLSRMRQLFDGIGWVVRNKRIEVAFYNGSFPNSPDVDRIVQRARILDVNQRVGVGVLRRDGGGHVAVMEDICLELVIDMSVFSTIALGRISLLKLMRG